MFEVIYRGANYRERRSNLVGEPTAKPLQVSVVLTQPIEQSAHTRGQFANLVTMLAKKPPATPPSSTAANVLENVASGVAFRCSSKGITVAAGWPGIFFRLAPPKLEISRFVLRSRASSTKTAPTTSPLALIGCAALTTNVSPLPTACHPTLAVPQARRHSGRFNRSSGPISAY